MLAVEKELRGRRIGSKLVQLCLDRMRRLGSRGTLFFDSGFGVQGSGFRVQGLGFRV